MTLLGSGGDVATRHIDEMRSGTDKRGGAHGVIRVGLKAENAPSKFLGCLDNLIRSQQRHFGKGCSDWAVTTNRALFVQRRWQWFDSASQAYAAAGLPSIPDPDAALDALTVAVIKAV